MADVFVSYARADKARVAPLVAAIEARGWSVWWDPEIVPGQEFDDRIDAELASAKAVLVVWTPVSVASRWVRGEARDAADRGVMVPVRFDAARLPIDARAIHTTDFDDWGGDAGSAPAQECLRALAAMIAPPDADAPTHRGDASAPLRRAGDGRRIGICVLPFNNTSGDPEQEYFSDGITEDIITALGKVSALSVTSRNTAFTYKGHSIDVSRVAREMKVSHVLEGSVRKLGGRVRINAQLIDGASNTQVWAERYDRDSSDIFALQDEISYAIAEALKLRLLPEEMHAIERRGTENVEAHDLYLMARQIYVTCQEVDQRSVQAIVRMCARATELDPDYAQAWALMATGCQSLRQLGVPSADGMPAALRALALDPQLAEAHAVKAYILQMQGAMDEAEAEVAAALELDPECYEANRNAGRLNYQMHRFEQAAHYFERAVDSMVSDINSAMMLVSCQRALGNADAMHQAAEVALRRSDAALARDPNNSTVIAYSANALAALGDGERARARTRRALLVDPDNWNMRYNFACALNVYLGDGKSALEVLEPLFAAISDSLLRYLKDDPDLRSLHDDPRFAALVAAAEARLAAASEGKLPA